MENDLRQALDRNEINVLFQPIVRLEDRTIAGFEVDPALGAPAARPGRAGRLHVDRRGMRASSSISAFSCSNSTARELAAWQAALEVEPPIFASVNMSSHHLLRHDLLQDVKAVIARTACCRVLSSSK